MGSVAVKGGLRERGGCYHEYVHDILEQESILSRYYSRASHQFVCEDSKRPKVHSPVVTLRLREIKRKIFINLILQKVPC